VQSHIPSLSGLKDVVFMTPGSLSTSFEEVISLLVGVVG
jgi:hypothetical protein